MLHYVLNLLCIQAQGLNMPPISGFYINSYKNLLMHIVNKISISSASVMQVVNFLNYTFV